MNVTTARGVGKADVRDGIRRNQRRQRSQLWRCLAATSALTVLAGLFHPAYAEDVEITSNTGAVNLDAQTGSTVRVFPGIEVSGGALGTGMSATTSPWTVTNDGKITGTNALVLRKGGGLDNSVGATVEGNNSGAIFGSSGGPAAHATVNNYGAINGKSVEGLSIFGGGVVTNYEGASISATSSSNALSLSGGTERTVINSGKIINFGTAGFSTGILIQGSAGSITNNATGEIKGDYNGIYASGSAPLTLINAGTVQSTRGPGVEMAGGGAITNTGTIQSSQNGILFSNSGTITNRGAIGSTGAGLAIQFNGSATHTLTLDTGSVLNGNVRGGTGVDRLQLAGSGSESTGRFLNFETLAMQGTNWELTNAGTFSTSAAVETGLLRVNGTLTSPTVTIGNGATLGGAGTIVGAVTNNGTIAAGNSIGTLSVQGSVAFSSASTLDVEANAAGQADLVAITGTASINGGTVQVLAAPGSYAPATAYTIVSTTAGRTGTFSGVTSNFAFLAPTLTYDANNVYLTLARNGIDLDAIGGTPNQRASGAGVQALEGGNPVFDAVLMLDIPGARRAFDQLSGEIHASVPGLLLDDSRFVREAAFDRIRQASADGSGAPGVWGHAYGASTDRSSDGNAADFEARSGGLFVGADMAIAETWRVGLVAGYGRSTFDADDRASSGSVDSVHLAAYGGGRWGDFSLTGGAAYAWQTIETGRSVAFPGFSDRLSARYDGYTGQVFGEAGYALHLGDATIEPTASLAYVDVGTDAFRETGDAAALASGGTDDQATFSTLGVRGLAPLTLGGLAAKLTGFVGWRHAFGDVAPTIDVAFAGQNAFTIRGTPIARDAAIVDLGLDLQTGATSRLALDYSGQFGGGTTSQAFKAGLHIDF